MNEEYIDIQVYDGDDETRYIKYEDMINLIEKIKIKQEERDKEIERLNNELEVSKNNEETYRLEMLDITKRLGLEENTLFDEVKDKVERLNNIIKEVREYIENSKVRKPWIKGSGILKILNKGE